MKKRWVGYAVWLIFVACLYFFENGTGTRVVLLCSLLLPLIPPLRGAFFSPDEPKRGQDVPRPLTVHSFVRREGEEPGDVRPYQPGDPLRRIHWKLSAKRDMLLVRETAREWESEEDETTAFQPLEEGKRKIGKPVLPVLAGMLFCVALLFLIPEANRGMQALCNQLFSASEQRNAYIYDFFPVPENQSFVLAALLLVFLFAALFFLLLLSRNRMLALAVMAGCSLFQAYFGLAFPIWVILPLYGFFAFLMLKRPVNRKTLMACTAFVLAVFLGTAVFLPGVDGPTEAASEAVRDRLSRITQSITGAVSELPEGETETRHVHTLSLETGERVARTEWEYRLVTVEEQQISIPHWINWLKVVLVSLLSVALLILPFAPFLLLNARKRKAQEARNAFADHDVGEAVRAIFFQVIAWFDETGNGAGNRLYRDWPAVLPSHLPEGYAQRFSLCAADFEEAAYSAHPLPEEKRERALALLRETERALWQTADWKQRLRIKYWVCLCE